MDRDIRTHVIALLESSQERERKIALLHYELDRVARTSGKEMIEAMALGHGDGGGHTDGHVSDKTLYIALNYQEKADKMNADTKEEIVVQLVELEREQKRLDYYISLLNVRQARVIKLLYKQNLPQGKVEKAMGLSAKTIRKLKNEALDALTEMYEFVADMS